jgi:hypothetical protein
MLQITRRDIEDAYSAASAARDHVRGISSKGESVVGTVVRTALVNAGALGVGVACGRYGALHLQGSTIPLDLAGGVALHGVAFFGLAGRYGEHLHSLADGVLAAYTTKAGIGIGTEMRANKGLPPAMTVSGSGNVQPRMGAAPPSHQVATGTNGLHVGNEPLTEAELAAMAHSFR